MVIEIDGKKYLSDTFGVNLPDYILEESKKYGYFEQVCNEGEYLFTVAGNLYQLELYALIDGSVVMIDGIVDFDGVMHRKEAQILDVEDVLPKIEYFYEKTRKELQINETNEI